MIVGAHMSIAGGFQNAFIQSKQLGCNAFQIFAKSPRGRNFVANKFKTQDYEFFRENMNNSGQQRGVIHSIYLINLGKSFDEAQLDRNSIIDDMIIAHNIGIAGVNIHLGKYNGSDKNTAIGNMVDNVEYILNETKHLSPYFVFENTAGQGSEIGRNFDELSILHNLIIERVGENIVNQKIRYCIDTCHAWASGYDINHWDEIVQEFDKYIGKDKILFIHLNDAKSILGSKLDRHANLGRGFIGLPALKKVILWGKDNNVPLILETPNMDLWQEEVKLILSIGNNEINEAQMQDFHNKNFKTEYLKKFENLASKGNQSLF